MFDLRPQHLSLWRELYAYCIRAIMTGEKRDKLRNKNLKHTDWATSQWTFLDDGHPLAIIGKREE